MPFPSWDDLIRRMLAHLKMLSDFADRGEDLEAFFDQQDALDCAELFAHSVAFHGEPRTVSVRPEQFIARLRESYLRSLDVNVISLGTWDLLPSFLDSINPDLPLP